MTQSLKDIGEFGLIRLLAQNLSRREGTTLGVGDDTAIIRPEGAKEDLLFTTDMLVENVHFKRNLKPELIGRKALACNISDIAAMAGTPTFAVVSIGIPPELKVSYIRRIYAGMNRLARQFGVGIIGGDTVRSRELVINVALLGKVKKGHAVLRSTAKEGDQIFLTGPVGGSLASKRHLTFIPKVKVAQFLLRHCPPSAMIDVSDGLVADLGHILEESKVGAVLFTRQIPHPANVSLQEALSDGEDFELIFTLPAKAAQRLQKLRNCPCRFYWIGEITKKSQGLQCFETIGRKMKIKYQGYQHF